MTQAHLERWQAEGTTTRGIASRFLDWATKTSLIDPNLKLQPHRRGTGPRLDAATIAEALGYSPITIERHSIDSSANYAHTWPR